MPKTILLLASNPKDTTRLRLDEEAREVYNGLRGAKRREDFVLQQVWAVRSEDVRRAMLDFEPQIVHFSGHGKGENGIAFEDNDGNTQLVSTETLADFFKAFSDSVECVVLNACYSEVQAQAIAEHIDFVIGMNQPIGDKAAIEFAVAFYDAIGAGKDIPFAFNLACNAIQWANIPEHLTPVLLTTGSHSQLKTRKKLSDPVSLLQSFANKISRNCVFIAPDLIRTKEETSRNIVVGKTINLKHLVDNSFMDRQGSINNAIKHLDQHVQDNLSSGNSQLVTFWIDGKSGSGKSVLLLQILQKLVLERNAKVFWISNEYALLERMLIEWVDSQIVLDEPVYIFIDDLNSPQHREQLDIQSIVQVISDIRSQDVQWPVIVTCSPPDYFEDFRTSGGNEGFLVKRWTIPLVNRSEQTTLLEWFQRRTGKIHKTGSAFEQDEGLFVSMMFELQYGDMEEFGKRFKARLDSNGLTEVIAQSLALNRLYIWTPEQWFNELSIEQKEALVILNAGNDFLYTSPNGKGNGYVRLTHPHLSDVIYKSIRPKSGGIERAEDLAIAFQRAIKFKDSLASKILLEVSKEGERLEDIHILHLVSRLAGIWMQHETDLLQSNPSQVAIFWVNWTRWATRNRKVASFFAPVIPIEKAIDSIGYSHDQWVEIWLQLWKCEPNYARLVDIALVWLEKLEYHNTGGSWYTIWHTLLSSQNIKEQKDILEKILELGIKELNNSDNYRWSIIWQTLIENRKSLPDSKAYDLVKMGVEWLPGRENYYPWGLVWQALLKQKDYLPAGKTIADLINWGIHWLKGREHEGQWSFIWEELLKQEDYLPDDKLVTELLTLGIHWLEGRENIGQWSFVWEELLLKKHRKFLPKNITSKDILNIGINWLAKSDQSQAQWPFVWEGIVEHWKQIDSDSRDRIFTQGLSWLETQEIKNSWPFVFQKSLSIAENDDQRKHLIELLKVSLNHIEVDSEKWFPVWDACIHNWKHMDEDAQSQILNQGFRWLLTHNNNSKWLHIYTFCLSKANGNERDEEIGIQILNEGINWIEANSHSYQALSLALGLLSDGRRYLTEAAEKRLTKWFRERLSENNINKTKWHSTWSFFVKHGENLDVELQQDIAKQGFEWLKKQEDAEIFISVFEECSSLVVDGVEYLDLFINWVDTKSSRNNNMHLRVNSS